MPFLKGYDNLSSGIFLAMRIIGFSRRNVNGNFNAKVEV